MKSKNKKEYKKYKEIARIVILEALERYNAIYRFAFRRVAIRNQKTRWGSCSKKGNLNFNYKAVFLSKNIVDYIVVHELCHLQEFNHSARFWALVEKTIPNYKQLRKELKNKTL